jgi:hypothetical protein
VEKRIVAIVRFEKRLESVRRTVDLSHGFDYLPSKANVFIKPNIVFWTRTTPFPKWGVITTSRVIEDMVILLFHWKFNLLGYLTKMPNFFRNLIYK